jgi:hypothetical protein
MAFPPTSIVITYIASPPTENVSSGVTQTNTATLSIPKGSGYSDYVQSILRAGGFWSGSSATATPGGLTFVPWSQITSIAAS